MSSSNLHTAQNPARPAIIGIDLGTSTSAIAVLREDGAPELIADENGDCVIPSVVQLSPEGELIVGAPAKSGAIAFHDRTAQEVKRLMGTTETVTLGDKTFLPEEISAAILRHLKAAAEAKLGAGAVRDVVISVPARFENEAREATKRAAERAGLNVLRLINEPTAAALAYGLNRMEAHQKVLVFDFGGGTLDVTILEMFQGILDVKTSVGDDKLGGKDVDEALVQMFRDTFQEQQNRKLPLPDRDRRVAQMLKEEAEDYKKRLSENIAVPVEMPYLSPEGGISFTLSRSALDEHLEGMLTRAMQLVNEALGRARLGWEDIDVLLPVGGSSRLPLFRRALEFCWGKALEDYENPDEAVARGAAIAAGIEQEKNAASDAGIMILDVSPHRLGVATIKQVGSAGQYVSDYFSELIPKDAKLPVKVRRDYNTLFSGDASITIRIYEATTDSNSCRDHHLISELPLRNLKGETSDEQVQVEFSYTLDGTLDVVVRYVNAPVISVDARFALGNAGAAGAAKPPEERAGMMTAAAAAMTGTATLPDIETADFASLWQDSLPCRESGPLLEQVERMETERPESAMRLRASADALRAALSTGGDDVQQHIDALADLLFELA